MKDVMIWPIYLDAEKSLNEGRKISKEYAVSEPRIKEIIKATQKLRYKYYAEEDKAYPGEWYNKSGRVIITNQTPSKKWEKPNNQIGRAIKKAKKEKEENKLLNPLKKEEIILNYSLKKNKKALKWQITYHQKWKKDMKKLEDL